MCRLYPYKNVKLLWKCFYINNTTTNNNNSVTPANTFAIFLQHTQVPGLYEMVQSSKKYHYQLPLFIRALSQSSSSTAFKQTNWVHQCAVSTNYKQSWYSNIFDFTDERKLYIWVSVLVQWLDTQNSMLVLTLWSTCKGNYSAISNNMKLVHWQLMGGLHYIQLYSPDGSNIITTNNLTKHNKIEINSPIVFQMQHV